MPVIKRYPNRKLYDTEAKRYITLDEIATLIRMGREVTIVDHATGEDLTALTLTQVIFEQEKKRRGFLPQTVLAGLIQAGGETMTTLRNTLASPLNLARHVDDEIEQRIQALIGRGELAAEEGRRLLDNLLGASSRPLQVRWSSEEELEKVLAKSGVPTREDLRRLLEELEALEVKLQDVTDKID